MYCAGFFTGGDVCRTTSQGIGQACDLWKYQSCMADWKSSRKLSMGKVRYLMSTLGLSGIDGLLGTSLGYRTPSLKSRVVNAFLLGRLVTLQMFACLEGVDLLYIGLDS